MRTAPQAPIQSSSTIVNGSGQLLPGYVEVIVTYYQPRGFSAIFRSSTLPVTARAVARGVLGASNAGVLTLASSGSGALSLGNPGIQAQRPAIDHASENVKNGATTATLMVEGGGTIQVNSNSSNSG